MVHDEADLAVLAKPCRAFVLRTAQAIASCFRVRGEMECL